MAKQDSQMCPIACFLDIFGDAWTLLIIREAFYGTTRFSEMQRNTGISKNLLSGRLSMLIEEGILSRVDVGERGSRFAYELTEKGQSLAPIFVFMVQWSNENIFKEGEEPVLLTDRKMDEPLKEITVTDKDGQEIGWNGVLAKPGPGVNKAARLQIMQRIGGARDS